MVNLVVTAPSSAGYVTAFGGTSRSATSSINFARGQTVANLVVVVTSADGTINLYKGALGSTPMIADVIGYYWAGQIPATNISGRVVDAQTGAPVAGLTVDDQFLISYDDETTFEDSTTTASDGAWTLRADPWHYDYVVTVDDRRSTPRHVSQGFGAPPGQGFPLAYVQSVSGTTTTGVNVSVIEGATITGTVTDKITGKPILAEIHKFTADGKQIDYSYTDTKGKYAFTLAVDPRGSVVCFKPADIPQPPTGWVAQCNDGSPWFHGEVHYGADPPRVGSVTPLHLMTGQIVTLNVALATGGAVSGSRTDGHSLWGDMGVLDSTGTMVQYADVGLNNAFTLYGLPPGQYTVCFLDVRSPSQCYRGVPWSARPGFPRLRRPCRRA